MRLSFCIKEAEKESIEKGEALAERNGDTQRKEGKIGDSKEGRKMEGKKACGSGEKEREI